MLKKWLQGGALLMALALFCALGAGAAEPETLDYEGPIVRNTTEAFPILSTAFSGSAPAWSDTATFEGGVYEGYYAQLDGIAQGFYRQLQVVLADPAAAFTAANKQTVNVGTAASPINLPAYTISVPHPAGATFPTVTAATQAQAEEKLGALVYRHALPALDALGRDHPEMPWASAHWGLSASFSMTIKTEPSGEVTLGVSTGKPLRLILVNPAPAVLTGCASGTFQSAVDAAVNTLNTDSRYALSDPGKTDLDKIRAIHDFLCRQITYAADGDATTAFDQNAYSALVSPYKTVCAGYTASTKLLCDYYGLPCVNVTGLGGERHAWNYVRMDDGQWYAMDCTWDDAANADPLYDFFLKGSATPVPYGWGTNGVIPFPQSHIETATWSNYTVMPYPTLAENDYVGYVLSAAPTARAVYGDTYGDVTFTGGAVETKEGAAVTGGRWFAGTWTDRDRADQPVPDGAEIPVYFSQNPTFDPIHIYADPFDYPLTATAALTLDKAPLTIQQAGVSGGAVTKVVFGGLKNGEQLTLGTDFTASAIQNGSYYDVTVTLLDTPLARHYALAAPTFSTSRNNATGAPTGAAVSPTGLSLTLGQSRRVSVTFTPAGSRQPTVTWAVTDAAVATVDETGLVTAVGAGSTTLTVTIPGFAAKSVPVTVSAAPTGLTLSDTAVCLTLDKGETHQLEASLLPAGASGEVRWSCDLTRVATVNDTGLVTPQGTGFAVVTAAVYAGASSTTPIATAQCMVSVFENNVPATKVTLTPSGYRFLNVGNTLQLTYTLTPDNVTDQAVFWTSSDPNVATVDATGLVTALAKGTATVTLSTATPGVRAACDVEVVVPVTAVALNVHTLDLIAGDTAALAADVTPEDNSYPGVTWTTSNASVATVDGEGRVTAVGPGTATVTATAGGVGAKKSDVCTVTVAAEDFTVKAMDLSFDPAAYGYAQPAAKALTIRSTGNRPATVTSVAVSDPAAFILSGSGGTVPAKGIFMGYTIRPAPGLGAGKHTATLTVTYHNGDTATAQVSFTVLKTDADYDALTLNSDTLTYGDVLQLTFLPRPVATLMAAVQPDQAALYLGDTLLAGPVTADDGGKYVLTCDTAQGLIPLGDQTLTFRYGGSDDLNAGGTQVPIHLAPKALDASMIALDLPAGGYVYDGTAKTPAVTLTHGGRTLGDGDYTLGYQNNVNAGTATVTLTGRGWYTGTVERTFSIAQRAGRVVALTAKSVPWDVTDPQSLDLAPVVAGLVLPSDVPVYGPVTVTAGGAYLQGAPAVDENGLLTFALAGLVDAPGSVVLTVPVTGLGNYAGMDVAVTVPVVEDAAVTVDLSGLVLTDRVYNGRPLDFTGSAAGTCSGGAYSSAFTYIWQDADGADLPAAPAEAGTYRLLVRTATPGFRGEAYKTVTIAPAPVTVTAGDIQVYRGAPLPELTYTISGLVEGDSFTDLHLSAPGTDRAGTWPITVSGGTLTHADCYAVTYRPGALIVLAPQVTASQAPVWDGAQSTLPLTAAPADLLAGEGTLVFAARYADGALTDVVRATLTGSTLTLPADLTTPGWKLFFLDNTLSPLCAPLTP